MVSEQRKDFRVVPLKNMYAALGIGPYVVGKILDISRGGLAFEHTSDFGGAGDIQKPLHIFLENDDFYMTGIACRVLYNMPCTSEISPTEHKTMRCGLKFEGLNDYHQDRLSSLIIESTFDLSILNES